MLNAFFIIFRMNNLEAMGEDSRQVIWIVWLNEPSVGEPRIACKSKRVKTHTNTRASTTVYLRGPKEVFQRKINRFHRSKWFVWSITKTVYSLFGVHAQQNAKTITILSYWHVLPHRTFNFFRFAAHFWWAHAMCVRFLFIAHRKIVIKHK